MGIKIVEIKNMGTLNEVYAPWTNNQLIVTTGGRFTIVAFDGKKPIGAGQVFLVNDPVWNFRWGSIENVFVIEEYRRKGVGTLIMKKLESYAQKTHCKFVRLTTRQQYKFYQSLGYHSRHGFMKELPIK